jgi:hypothetical protein
MQKFRKVSVTMVGALAFATALFASGSGRNAGVPIPGATNVSPVTMGTVNQRPADFGPTGETVSTFHFSAFRPIDTSFSVASDTTTVWPTSLGASHTIFMANLQVPEGAVIDFVSFGICKADATATTVVAGGSDNNVDFVDINIPAVSGCFSVGSPSLGYQVAANTGHVFDLFVDWQDAAVDGSVALAGAEVWWHRTVSPGPANPSFLDVPVSDPRFAFIEAIYAAGVTAGCGGGNYCPDAPLTRGQMAVFIAKALGLYWPN